MSDGSTPEFAKNSPGWNKQQKGSQSQGNGAEVLNFPKKRGRPRKTHRTHQTHHRKPDAPDIRLVTGERARATDEALAILRKRGDIYERSGELIRVAGGRIEPVADDWLLDRFDRTINFVAVRDGQEHLKDAPAWLAKRINAKKGERGLPELRAVITAPTIRDDGTLLDKPGFDTATGLLLTKDTWPAVPANPTFPDLKTAAKTLWSPSPNSPSSTPRRAACT